MDTYTYLDNGLLQISQLGIRLGITKVVIVIINQNLSKCIRSSGLFDFELMVSNCQQCKYTLGCL